MFGIILFMSEKKIYIGVNICIEIIEKDLEEYISNREEYVSDSVRDMGQRGKISHFTLHLPCLDFLQHNYIPLLPLSVT